MSDLYEELLYQLYITEGRTKGEIAKEFGVKEDTIKKKLRRYKIRKIKPWRGRKKYFAKKYSKED